MVKKNCCKLNQYFHISLIYFNLCLYRVKHKLMFRYFNSSLPLHQVYVYDRYNSIAYFKFICFSINLASVPLSSDVFSTWDNSSKRVRPLTLNHDFVCNLSKRAQNKGKQFVLIGSTNKSLFKDSEADINNLEAKV